MKNRTIDVFQKNPGILYVLACQADSTHLEAIRLEELRIAQFTF